MTRVPTALREAVMERDRRRKYAREWARAHYVPKPRPSLEERLWARVQKSDGCWEWTGPLTAGGRYGHIVVEGRAKLVHRVSYELANGPVPDGLELDHLCRNRRCVRPDHLEAVTHRENMRRASHSYESGLRPLECNRGHGLPPSRYGDTWACRECRREDNTAYRRRKGIVDLSSSSKRMWANRSPEERAEISRKIWATRRANARAS